MYKGKEGIDSTQRAVNLTRFLITVPKPHITLLTIAIFSMTIGVVFSLLQNSDIIRSIMYGVGNGLFILGIPSFLAAVTCYALHKDIGFRRIVFLSLVSMVLYAFGYGFFIIAPAQFSDVILFLTYGLVFALWYVSLSTVFGLTRSALVFSAIQLAYFGLFLVTGKYITVGASPIGVLLKLYLSSAVFFVSSYLFLLFINAPMKQVLGIKSTEAFNLFMEHWMGRSKRLEKLFQKISDEIITTIALISFKRRDKTINIVVPYVHFGPFGALGGSRFSHLIAEHMKDLGDCIVLHSTATHDFNPSSEQELTKITAALKDSQKNMKYTERRAAFTAVKVNDSTVHVIDTGGTALIGMTRTPMTTEDMEYGFGEALMNVGEQHRNVVVVFDEHNCETGEVTYFSVGHQSYWNYKTAIKEALTRGGKKKKYPINVGYGYAKSNEVNIGSAGIKALALSLDKNIIFVVLDTNGITPDARHDLLSKLHQDFPGSFIEIITTDTHEINNVKGVLNPINTAQVNRVYAEIYNAVKNALEDIRPARVGVSKSKVKLRVLGFKHAIEIVSTVNSIIAIGKITLPFILLWTILTVLWALTIIG